LISSALLLICFFSVKVFYFKQLLKPIQPSNHEQAISLFKELPQTIQTISNQTIFLKPFKPLNHFLSGIILKQLFKQFKPSNHLQAISIFKQLPQTIQTISNQTIPTLKPLSICHHPQTTSQTIPIISNWYGIKPFSSNHSNPQTIFNLSSLKLFSQTYQTIKPFQLSRPSNMTMPGNKISPGIATPLTFYDLLPDQLICIS
jgi:hypothetical protein